MANSFKQIEQEALSIISAIELKIKDLNEELLNVNKNLSSAFKGSNSGEVSEGMKKVNKEYKELNTVIKKQNALEKEKKSQSTSLWNQREAQLKKESQSESTKQKQIESAYKQREAQENKILKIKEKHAAKDRQYQAELKKASLEEKAIIQKKIDLNNSLRAQKEKEFKANNISNQKQIANEKKLLESKRKSAQSQRELEQKSRESLARQKAVALEMARPYNKLISQQKLAKKTLQDLTISQGSNNRETRKAQRAYDKLSKKVNQANQATSNFSKTGLGGAVRGVRNLISAFGVIGGVTLFANVVRDAFSLTKQLDSMAFSMRAVIKDSRELGQTQEFLRDSAQAYGADLLTITNRYIKFRAATQQAGLTAKETQKIFGTMTKAAGVLGLKKDELQGIFLALEQMVSKGKITTEELRRQLGERLPGAMDIMANSLGVTTAKLDDMLKKGEVISKDVLPGFARQVEIAFGLDKVKKVATLQAATSRLRNAWVILVEDFNKGNDASSFLMKIFDSLATNLSSIVSLVLKVGTAFVVYKSVLIATSLATKIYNSQIFFNIGFQIALQRETLKTAIATKTLGRSMLIFGRALLTNPIFLTIAALTALYFAFKDTSDASGEAAKELSKLNREQVDLNTTLSDSVSKVDDLMKRYDELSRNSSDATEKQQELKDVIVEIGNKVPDAVVAIGDYNQALEIGAEVARDWVKANGELVVANAEGSIFKQTALLKGYQSELEKIKKIQEGGFAEEIGDFGKIYLDEGQYKEVLAFGVETLDSGRKAELLNYFKEIRDLKKESISTIFDSEDAITAVRPERINDRQKGENVKKRNDIYIAKKRQEIADAKDKILEIDEKILQNEKDLIDLRKDSVLQGEVDKVNELVDANAKLNSEREKLLGIEKKRSGSGSEKEDNTLKDEFELAKRILEIQIESQEEIINNEDKFLKERLDANSEYLKSKKKLIDLEAKYETKSNKDRADKIKLIEVDKKNQITKLIKEGGDNRNTIIESDFKKQMSLFDKVSINQKRNLDKEITDYQNSLIEKGLSREEIEEKVNEKIKEIRKEDLKNLIENEIKKLEAIAITSENRIEVEERLIALRKMLSDVNLPESENIEKTTKSLKDFFGSFQDDFFSEAGFEKLNELFLTLDDEGFTKMHKLLEESENDWAVWANGIMAVGQEAFNFINQQRDASFQAEYSRLEQQKDIAIQFAGENSDAREEIERQYEAKRKQIQRRQAESQKKQAIVNTIFNTAQGIVSALAQVPKFDGGISATTLATIIGGIGAAQIALIAATPVPEFFRGTMNAPEGWAMVDEKRPEVHTDSSGKIKSTGEGGANMRYLDRGDKIYKSHEEYFNKELSGVLGENDIVPYNQMINSISPSITVESGLKKEDFIREIRSMKNSLMTKEGSVINIDKNGFSTKITSNGKTRDIQNNILRLKTRII